MNQLEYSVMHLRACCSDLRSASVFEKASKAEKTLEAALTVLEIIVQRLDNLERVNREKN